MAVLDPSDITIDMISDVDYDDEPRIPGEALKNKALDWMAQNSGKIAIVLGTGLIFSISLLGLSKKRERDIVNSAILAQQERDRVLAEVQSLRERAQQRATALEGVQASVQEAAQLRSRLQSAESSRSQLENIRNIDAKADDIMQLINFAQSLVNIDSMTSLIKSDLSLKTKVSNMLYNAANALDSANAEQLRDLSWFLLELQESLGLIEGLLAPQQAQENASQWVQKVIIPIKLKAQELHAWVSSLVGQPSEESVRLLEYLNRMQNDANVNVLSYALSQSRNMINL